MNPPTDAAVDLAKHKGLKTMGISDCGALAATVVIGAFVIVWNEGNSAGATEHAVWVPNRPAQNSPNPASSSSKDSGKAEVEACLRSDDRILRRRAIWKMAGDKADSNRVVDAVMGDRQQFGCGRLVTNLGTDALPRLYHYLAHADADTRYRSLPLIAMAGRPDANALAELDRLLKEHPHDKALQILAEFVRGVSPEVAETHLNALGAGGDSPLDGVEWLLLTHETTRGPAITRARMHLADAMGNLRHGSAELGKVELELQKAVLSLAFATRQQPLGPQEVDCLKELESEISKPCSNYDALVPAVVMTRWAAGGRRDRQLLDKALSLFGRDVTGCEARTLGGLIVIFGDVMLSPDSVPVLVSRATDQRAEERVRVGALRLLAWLAPTDDRVHKTYRDLLKSESEREPIRLATAEGISFLIEGQGREGALLETAKTRLSVEKSRTVLDALTSSIRRLMACP